MKELLPVPGGNDIDNGTYFIDSSNSYGKLGTIDEFMEVFRTISRNKWIFGIFMQDVEPKLGRTTKEGIDIYGDIMPYH